MTKTAQNRAVESNRRRLKERGMSRYEVRGLDDDKELVRSLAKQLAVGDRSSSWLRAEMTERLAGPALRRGGVLAALRRSPLVGAKVQLKRGLSHGRPVRL
jgi:hypothetical protein